MERRKFIQLSTAILLRRVFNSTKPEIGLAHFIEPVGNISLEKQTLLQEYIEWIEPLKTRLRENISETNLFTNFKRITQTAQTQDFEMYFPMYLAGQKKYDIPWFYLWIMHLHETNCSRHPYPEHGSYVGGMQRHPGFWPEDLVSRASSGWEFLEGLPQRYSKEKGSRTNDYQEILFAAWKLREDANTTRKVNPSMSDENAFLRAQKNYSRNDFASDRIKQYQQLKPILATNQLFPKEPPPRKNLVEW